MDQHSKEKTKAIAGLVILILTLVNSGLQLAGYDTIPVNNEKLELSITMAAAAIISVYTWWKNQNVTKEAAKAQKVLDTLKDKENKQEEI